MIPSPEDHVAISQLLAQYCLALDLDDVDGWVALFTPDGSYEVYGHSFTGHDGLRKMLDGADTGLHMGGPAVIEMLGPDRASVLQNGLFIDRAGGPSRSVVYTDELQRTDAGWRFAKRRCQFMVPDGFANRPARERR
jgi:SnoaL-like domain